MEEIQKHNQQEDKKIWSNPDLELVDINGGTNPEFPEATTTLGGGNPATFTMGVS